MSIIQLPLPIAANTGVTPNIKTMTTTDSLATITTAGYMNQFSLEGYPLATTDVLHVLYNFNTTTNVGSFGIFTVSISNGVITLTEDITASEVTYTAPSIANHIATYTNTTGNISKDAATAINGGNIQAGLSGTAGTLASFPGTASKGSLKIAAVANTGDTVTTISNAAMGQASVVSIPDPGAATANFIVSALSGAGTQHITSGALQVDAGIVSSGLAAGGFVGEFDAYPTTGSKGKLSLKAAVNATGDFSTTISNATAVAQSQVITIPDSGAATSNFVLSQSTLATNNVAFTKVITATAAALATAGKVNVAVHPSATSQFAVLDVKVLNSTGLSGGGGDRLLALSDGTIAFNQSGITAALLGTPICTVWGGTGNPIAAGTSQVSTAGADIYLQYAGGTTDYTLGSVQLAITLVQVTA